jgi:hypothetical protein
VDGQFVVEDFLSAEEEAAVLAAVDAPQPPWKPSRLNGPSRCAAHAVPAWQSHAAPRGCACCAQRLQGQAMGCAGAPLLADDAGMQGQAMGGADRSHAAHRDPGGRAASAGAAGGRGAHARPHSRALRVPPK